MDFVLLTYVKRGAKYKANLSELSLSCIGEKIYIYTFILPHRIFTSGLQMNRKAFRQIYYLISFNHRNHTKTKQSSFFAFNGDNFTLKMYGLQLSNKNIANPNESVFMYPHTSR